MSIQNLTRRGFGGAAALGCASLLASGCRADKLQRTATNSFESTSTIGTYASAGPLRHSTNTHWIRTERRVFVVDAQWVRSEASLARRAIGTDTDIVGVLITHPHTDHFGGIDQFRDGDGGTPPIYASALTALSIQNDAQGFIARRHAQFGDDFPAAPLVPNRRLEHRSSIDVGGPEAIVLEFPANESLTTTVLWIPELNAAFVGDLVYDRRLAIFAEGMSALENWRRQLAQLQRILPAGTTIYPGHGRHRPIEELIAEQVHVLDVHREIVLAEADAHGGVRKASIASMVASISDQLKDHRSMIGLKREVLIERSIEWLAAEVGGVLT